MEWGKWPVAFNQHHRDVQWPVACNFMVVKYKVTSHRPLYTSTMLKATGHYATPYLQLCMVTAVCIDLAKSKSALGVPVYTILSACVNFTFDYISAPQIRFVWTTFSLFFFLQGLPKLLHPIADFSCSVG